VTASLLVLIPIFNLFLLMFKLFSQIQAYGKRRTGDPRRHDIALVYSYTLHVYTLR
jgi:hypothetical protein